MAGHPQSSPRGLWAKQRIDLTGSFTVSGQAVFGLLSANSTALILPNSVRVGAKTSYLSSNSTGILIGARYISTNTTGNSTT